MPDNHPTHPTPGLKAKIYQVVFESDTRGGKLFDIILLWLILLSIASVFLESITSVRLRYYALIRPVEWGFTILFSAEYLLRVYSSPRRFRYIFSFLGIVDLISILPSYLSLLVSGYQYLIVFRAIRLLRVFRILKLSRYLYEGNILATALRASARKIIVFLSTVVTLVVIIGTLMYLIEGEKNGFTSIPISIYWAIVTITTVGYGDISPQTALGQVVASVLMIVGYAIIAVPTGIVTVEIGRASAETARTCTKCKNTIRDTEAVFCKYCGNKLKMFPKP